MHDIPGIYNFILFFIVWVCFYSKMLTSVKFTEEKVKNAKMVQLRD